MGGIIDDLTGKRFERLLVTGYAGKDKGNHSKWLCRCDCGREKIITGYNLKSGAIKSCGCLRREIAGNLNKTHDGSNSRLYSIYRNMISRTENPKASAYDVYGGRGISICQEWRNDFAAFQKWALANGYRDDLSIDRIENDKGYFPDNCRWIKMNAQFNNRRNNLLLTYKGETKTVAEWARHLAIKRRTLYSRLNAGWSVEQALSTPTKGGRAID